MKTVSIGYHCACNDFAVLATLNNNHGHIPEEDFANICKSLHVALEISGHYDIVILERQDTPDYVEVEQ